VNELFDVCTCAGPYFKDCAVSADGVELESVYKFVADEESAAVEDAEGSELLDGQVFEGLEGGLVLWGEGLCAVDVA
jgi:hypothetical protein